MLVPLNTANSHVNVLGVFMFFKQKSIRTSYVLLTYIERVNIQASYLKINIILTSDIRGEMI